MSPDWHPETVTPIDGLEWARAHPHLLLGKGYTPSNELLLDRLRDALWILQPVARVWTEVRDGWGFLACEVDWLSPPGPRDPFREVVAFPEAGQNSCRPEILVTAFSRVAATFTSTSDEVEVLTGAVDVVEPVAVEYARSLVGPSGRAVVLRA